PKAPVFAWLQKFGVCIRHEKLKESKKAALADSLFFLDRCLTEAYMIFFSLPPAELIRTPPFFVETRIGDPPPFRSVLILTGWRRPLSPVLGAASPEVSLLNPPLTLLV